MNSTSPEHARTITITRCHTLPTCPATPRGRTGTTGHAGHGEPGAHDRHEGHSVAMFRDRFWITLLLSIPTLRVERDGAAHGWLFGAGLPGVSVHSRALRHRRLSVRRLGVRRRADCGSCAIDCPG